MCNRAQVDSAEAHRYLQQQPGSGGAAGRREGYTLCVNSHCCCPAGSVGLMPCLRALSRQLAVWLQYGGREEVSAGAVMAAFGCFELRVFVDPILPPQLSAQGCVFV